ncbi:hypothetical protein IL992_39465 [Microbispora sp. NEAU-D428]|uniref:endonuclease domain-containing protein n=1 Tax=Microbispora sitophila TaxID=2771537 RepID=UPI001867C57D|nr:endonuclease domain-containing protein [Microbispora sitophila]MBE3015203.1 hypothetical protein [Microbispora sitophila]
MKEIKCATPHCKGRPDRKVSGEPACQACYRRWRRYGTTEKKEPVKPAIRFEIIEQNSIRDESAGCLTWTGATDRDGYPRYYDGTRYASGKKPLVYVRRWLLDQEYSSWPKGQIVEDVCGNRLCVEREHLQVATQSTGRKTMAGINSRKNECWKGHPLTEENTYLTSDGRRQCKQCRWEAAMRSQGKNPDELTRGIWNGNKTHCPQGHEYAVYGAFNQDGSRWCRPCRINTNRKSVYGITTDEYAAMLKAQGYKCKTCLTEFEHDGIRTTAHIDHDHETGKVRGILCQQCNRALGLLYENVDTMRRMIDYVLANK